ncbi:myocilin-like [Oncorhynchus kisutch]|uniref:Myocilin n=1 Tax=Oncorhynchus kisutch TaxID=8019 RepID=A0A8C7MAF5_ONCKI|nr:myocilin-like [Oncorhynchus kisutch]
MWLLLNVCLFCLLQYGEGQDRATLWRGNDRSGHCQYTFTVPSPSETSCPPTASGGPEMEGLKTRLSLLEVLVARLTGGETRGPGLGAGSEAGLQEALTQAMGERSLLQGEKEHLERDVEGLQRRVEEMRRETERLKSRPCYPQSPLVPPSVPLQDSGLRLAGDAGVLSHLVSNAGRQGDTGSLRDPAWRYGDNAGFQELKAEVTEIPAPSTEDSTGCGELISIGEPVSHRKADSIAGKYGVWMQDPEAVAPYGGKMVWRIDTVGSEVRQLFGYEDMDQLSKGYPSKVLLLPEPVESTGATLYRGSLYYQRRRSRTLLRYDLASESIAARRDLPHAGFHGQFPYSWGGYTDVDLGVDEQGLWAVYSTNKAKGAVVVSQLDPHNLAVKRSWETSIRKNSVANAFVICGRLYTVASYTAPNTTINFMFDTATGQGKQVALPFRNKYRYNSMVDYNPAQRKLHAWDNFHMVSYDVRLGHQ